MDATRVIARRQAAEKHFGVSMGLPAVGTDLEAALDRLAGFERQIEIAYDRCGEIIRGADVLVHGEGVTAARVAGAGARAALVTVVWLELDAQPLPLRIGQRSEVAVVLG